MKKVAGERGRFGYRRIHLVLERQACVAPLEIDAGITRPARSTRGFQIVFVIVSS